MSEKAPLIFQQIPKIMRDIEPIAKGHRNAQQNYNYRGVDDVMNELAPILAAHNVFPVVTSLEEGARTDSITSSTGTKGYHVIRRYLIKLYAEDGSYIESVTEGEAVDYGDKAVGKSHSYAYRDFMLKTFVIPTAGDHDTDSKNHNLMGADPKDYRAEKKPAAAEKKAAPAPAAEAPKAKDKPKKETPAVALDDTFDLAKVEAHLQSFKPVGGDTESAKAAVRNYFKGTRSVLSEIGTPEAAERTQQIQELCAARVTELNTSSEETDNG